MFKRKTRETIGECSCSSNECCGCSCCNTGMILGGIAIAATLVMSIATFCKVQSSSSTNLDELRDDVAFIKENILLQAGGEEGYNLVKQIYSSDYYVNQNIESAQQYLDSLTMEESDEGEKEADIYSESTYSSDKTYTAENMMNEVNNLLDTAPVRGNKDGRFAIIEYTELLCPFCQRHSQQGTINQVIEQFPGEVSSVSQHFLIHGEPALRLSAAMECIAETNPEVYHQIMEEAFASSNLNVTTLEEIAGNHGVNVEAMDACYKEGKYISKVYDMMNMGSTLFGVSGTPGNVIVDKETGKFEVVAGAYPVEEFVNVINSMKNA